MNKTNVPRWPFQFTIILAILISWVGVVGPAHAAKPELQIITEITPPASFIDAHGNLTGLAVEVVQAIQQEIGIHIEIQVMPWARGYLELSRTPNIALFSTTRTPVRESLFHWVGPLLTAQWTMYALKGNGLNITNLDDAKSIGRIGVYRDDARAQFLKGNGFDNLDICNNQDFNFRKLLVGRVDAVISSKLGMKEFRATSPADAELIEAILEFGARDLYIAFSMGTDPETLRIWQDAFGRLEERGAIQRIRDKWFY